MIGALGRACRTRRIAFATLRVNPAACTHLVKLGGTRSNCPDVAHHAASCLGSVTGVTHGLVRRSIPGEAVATRVAPSRLHDSAASSHGHRGVHFRPVLVLGHRLVLVLTHVSSSARMKNDRIFSRSCSAVACIEPLLSYSAVACVFLLLRCCVRVACTEALLSICAFLVCIFQKVDFVV